MKVVYKGRESKLPHRGRGNVTGGYIFCNGQPTDVTNEIDVAYFRQKALKNPGTWEIVEEKSVRASVGRAVAEAKDTLKHALTKEV